MKFSYGFDFINKITISMNVNLDNIKSLLIFCFLISGMTGCYVYERTSSRFGSTYTPEQYQFSVDSLYLEAHGEKWAKWRIENGTADDWIVDSITYCNFYLRQGKIKIPIVPFIFGLRFNRKNSSHNLTISLHDIKLRHKTLDSISYKFYDNSQYMFSEGGFSYYGKKGLNTDSLLINPSYNKYMPNVIDMNPKLEPTDSIIYGDIELFFTDINDSLVIWAEQKIEFRYSKLSRLTADMNW